MKRGLYNLNGGTLVVSRYTNWFPFIKAQLEEMGFPDVSTTEQGKDALNMKIIELKPRLIIIDTAFYYSATPYMTSELLRLFPKLNIVAVSLGEYPASLAMRFLSLGARSYANILDGKEEFSKGLVRIRDGKIYISPSVQRGIEEGRELPETKVNLSEAEFTVLQLISNCFDVGQIANIMHVSNRTVETYKKNINNVLHSRNEREMVRVASHLKLTVDNELVFYAMDKQKKIKRKVLTIQYPC
jgi:DNA-binding NarL/FixJ family response regulator